MAEITGTPEVLAPAKKLIGLPGIDWETGWPFVRYLHLLMDRHQVIFAEGIASETLLPGPMARVSLGEAAFAQIRQTHPQILGQADHPARPLATGKALRQIRRQHLSHPLPLQDGPPHRSMITRANQPEVEILMAQT